MARKASGRRRPAAQITLPRAARLYRLVASLASGPRSRDDLLASLAIGLRTFYRELDLLRRCGVKVRLENREYSLRGTAEEAEGRLPFPDPQLSFAEAAELARGPGEAARRLAGLHQQVVATPGAAPKRTPRKRSATKG